MKISTLIPTYCRPKDLERCLDALKQQTRLADQVIVVVRDTDQETWDFLQTYSSDVLPIDIQTVKRPGVVAAMNLGLNVAKHDIVALTDDDAAPFPDWLARIEQHFVAEPQLGAVGGRDWLYYGDKPLEGSCREVGKLHWFGKVTGNHHLGCPEAKLVDVLKGVNVSYRMAAIEGMQFDERLLGTGAQVHWELGFNFTLKQRGWQLMYDPKVAVAHYPGQRFDEDQRFQFNSVSEANMAHNETLALLEYLSPFSRLVFALWSFFIGTSSVLGLAQVFRLLPTQGVVVFHRWYVSLKGRAAGWKTWYYSKHGKTV